MTLIDTCSGSGLADGRPGIIDDMNIFQPCSEFQHWTAASADWMIGALCMLTLPAIIKLPAKRALVAVQ